MTVDLCVVNHNTRSELDRLITTLLSDSPVSDARNWELHAADNYSEDDSRAYLERASTPVNILLNKNIGYARACNQLAMLGHGDIIGLLNSDIWMTTSDVMAIEESFSQNPQIDILGPKQRDEQGFITHAGITGTNIRPKHRGWKNHDAMDIQFRDLVPMVTVSGSAYFIRRRVWDKLAEDNEYQGMLKEFNSDGLFPDDIFDYPGAFLPTWHYYEETFCSYFARHRGHEIYYDGRISIGHTWHASHTKGSDADKGWSESQFLFRRACDYLGINHD